MYYYVEALKLERDIFFNLLTVYLISFGNPIVTRNRWKDDSSDIYCIIISKIQCCINAVLYCTRIS